jgi:hypothetical protein
MKIKRLFPISRFIPTPKRLCICALLMFWLTGHGHVKHTMCVTVTMSHDFSILDKNN